MPGDCMPATINLSENNLIAALGDYLKAVLGDSTMVIRSQGNRVSLPTGDFVLMTPINLPAKSMGVVSYTDDEIDQARHDTRTLDWRVQLDFYGDIAQSWAATVATLFRTEYSADLFEGTGLAPLYAEDPMQSTIVQSEDQWNNRWILDVHLQPRIIITTPQQFADQLNIDVAETNARFPPGA